MVVKHEVDHFNHLSAQFSGNKYTRCCAAVTTIQLTFCMLNLCSFYSFSFNEGSRLLLRAQDSAGKGVDSEGGEKTNKRETGKELAATGALRCQAKSSLFSPSGPTLSNTWKKGCREVSQFPGGRGEYQRPPLLQVHGATYI